LSLASFYLRMLAMVWTNYDDVNDVVISDDVAFELETM